MHLNVVGEPVDADLRKVDAGRAVDAKRHLQLDGGRVERVEIGVIEVAGLQRGRDVGRDQAEILCLTHDVDRHVAVLDRRDGDAAQPPVGWLAVVGDPLVVEPGEARGELGILERRRAEPEAGIEHHRVDLIAIGVAEHAFGRPAVDSLRGGEAVLGRAARAGAAGLGIVAALDHQSRHVVARRDVFGPALHRFDRQ